MTGVALSSGRPVGAAGAAALAAGVHHEVGVAGLRPQGVAVREAAADRSSRGTARRSAAGRSAPLGTCSQAFTGVAAEAGERHVVGVDQGELVVDRGERREQVVGACLLDGPPPEVDEVLGLGHLGTVLAQRGQVEIEEWHGIRA